MNRRRRIGPGLALGAALALGGCGGDGGGAGSGGSGLAALAGLYDLTVTIDGETDVGYLEIRPDATLVRYDYQQDDFGSGANCWVVSGPIRTTALGDGRYAVALGGETGELTLLPGDAGGLYVAEERFETINGFPQTVTVAEEYPRVTGLSTADLAPCA